MSHGNAESSFQNKYYQTLTPNPHDSHNSCDKAREDITSLRLSDCRRFVARLDVIGM